MSNKLKGFFLATLLVASATVTCSAATVPHNGAYKAKYGSIVGKDDYYKRQAMDGTFSGDRNGCTMMYIKDGNAKTTASGGVYYEQRTKHVSTIYAVAESHSHSATDHLVY